MKKKGEQILAGGRGSNTQAAIQKSVLEKNIANFWTNVKWENNKAKMIYESDTPILSPMELAFQKAGYFDQTGQEQYMQKEEKDAEKQSMLKVKDGRMFSIPADSNVSKLETNTPETGNSDLFSDIHFQATERMKNGPQRTLSVGITDNIATVYNIGQIKEAAAPEGSIISAIGSMAQGATASDTRVSHNFFGVNSYSMQDGRENSQIFLRNMSQKRYKTLLTKKPIRLIKKKRLRFTLT